MFLTLMILQYARSFWETGQIWAHILDLAIYHSFTPAGPSAQRDTLRSAPPPPASPAASPVAPSGPTCRTRAPDREGGGGRVAARALTYFRRP